MKKRAEFDLEKVFKMVMNNFYDEVNYDYYSKKLDMTDKIKIIEHLLNETDADKNDKINFKVEADKILSGYYKCPIEGNEFIKPIKDITGLTEEEQEWIENIYDVNRIYLLYNKKNIRVVVQLNYNIDRETYWEVSLLDFVNYEELTVKQKYRVYVDVYNMLMKEC